MHRKWRKSNEIRWHKKLKINVLKVVKMDPFTNQPYAFDDHGVPADSLVEFNNGIREITVCVNFQPLN